MITPPTPLKSSLRTSNLNNLPNPLNNPLASLSATFISSLFSCPIISLNSGQPSLDSFIAYSLYRTQLSSDVNLAALVLLLRLKSRFPNATGSAGQRLYLAALMISSKVINDDTFANTSWHIVARNQFSLKEINQMERELFAHLNYKVTVQEYEINSLSYHLQSLQSSLLTPPPTPLMNANHLPKRKKLNNYNYSDCCCYPSPPPTPPSIKSQFNQQPHLNKSSQYKQCQQQNEFINQNSIHQINYYSLPLIRS